MYTLTFLYSAVWIFISHATNYVLGCSWQCDIAQNGPTRIEKGLLFIIYSPAKTVALIKRCTAKMCEFLNDMHNLFYRCVFHYKVLIKTIIHLPIRRFVGSDQMFGQCTFLSTIQRSTSNVGTLFQGSLCSVSKFIPCFVITFTIYVVRHIWTIQGHPVGSTPGVYTNSTKPLLLCPRSKIAVSQDLGFIFLYFIHKTHIRTTVYNHISIARVKFPALM